MRVCSPYRYRVWAMLLGALLHVGTAQGSSPQTDAAAESVLLSRARTLEARGRLDLAKGDWTQVLLLNPKSSEALAGLVRASRADGHPADAAAYQSRLRALVPNDVAAAHGGVPGAAGTDRSAQLVEAARLTHAGEPNQAMVLYRGLYGSNPPPGEAALGYYEAEAATETGRPHAVAGLRALVDRFPQESRYQIALGETLSTNPRTRAEGRKLLERYPGDPRAASALRQSEMAKTDVPAAAGHVGATPSVSTAGTVHPLSLSGGQIEARTGERARSGDKPAAPDKLLAEQRYRTPPAKGPGDQQATAGHAEVRAAHTTTTAGKATAASSGPKRTPVRPAVHVEVVDRQYEASVNKGTDDLRRGDLPGAEGSFRAALVGHPDDVAALGGLGESLLLRQQNEAAASVYLRYTRAQAIDPAGWLGLLKALAGQERYREVLDTEDQAPPAARKQLADDPAFFLVTGRAAAALGHRSEADHILAEGLDLPFPAGGHGLSADAQVPYASLLVEAGRGEQAIQLLRQILATDASDTAAWVGLVTAQHASGHDTDALTTIGHMPSARYGTAFAQPAFVTTVAAIHEAAGHNELAQTLLESLLTTQRVGNQVLYAPAEIQLAGLYLRRGDPVRAQSLFRDALTQMPDSAGAWSGRIAELHATGHDTEALVQLGQIPPAAQGQLSHDVVYLDAVGAVYKAQAQPRAAAFFFAKAQDEYVAQGAEPPSTLEIEMASLLLAAGDDADLRKLLLYLGGRMDLTDEQRAALQLVWAQWVTRRAVARAAGGDERSAVTLLTTASASFAANREALQCLANGYTGVGLPAQAVAIFRAQDMGKASATLLRAAIGAALAAGDRKQTEIWLVGAQQRFPGDPELQLLAGRAEQARGHAKRAAELYRAALQSAPSSHPGAALASELSTPPLGGELFSAAAVPVVPVLSVDLEPMPPATTTAPIHPYLPSYAELPKDVANGDLTKPPLLTLGPCAGLPGCVADSPGIAPLPDLSPVIPGTSPISASSRGRTLRQYAPG